MVLSWCAWLTLEPVNAISKSTPDRWSPRIGAIPLDKKLALLSTVLVATFDTLGPFYDGTDRLSAVADRNPVASCVTINSFLRGSGTSSGCTT
jgi:hypothetical protein